MESNVRNIPGLLRHIHKNYDYACALAFKEGEKWYRIPTSRMVETILTMAAGLRKLGLKSGDSVAIVADSSPNWVMMDMAILCAGGISVPMFGNIARDNLIFQLEDSNTRILFAGSDSDFDVMEPLSGKLDHIITAGKSRRNDKTTTLDDLMTMGKKETEAKPIDLEKIESEFGENDLATIIYTSGSTGRPKGVELSHGNLMSQVVAASQRFQLNPESDLILSCLPLAHIFQRMVTYYFLSTGTGIFFTPDIKRVGEDMRELHPTVTTLVPRLLEKVFAKMQANVETATGLKGRLGRMAFQRAQDKASDSSMSPLDFLFGKLVYSKMRHAMGGRLRLVISGGAPLSPKLANFFLNVGVPIYEGYGLTEASPVIGANYPGKRKIGTIGPTFPGVDVRIADDGEILARGPNIMKGYHNQPEETAKVIDAQGWLHTGDLGHVDPEGFIKITGRKKELFKTANGKFVAPVPIEFALSENKLVDMAMVVAEGKKYATCLIFPDFENLHTFKEERGFADSSDEDYLQSDDCRNYLQNQVDAMNERLNHWEQIRQFRIITKPLSVEGGQLTPSMKIRRHIVAQQYGPDIDSMYPKD